MVQREVRLDQDSPALWKMEPCLRDALILPRSVSVHSEGTSGLLMPAVLTV